MKYKVTNNFLNTNHNFLLSLNAKINTIRIMQPAEAYILNQEAPYKTILLHLQVLIEHTLPDLELRYKYKIPFYYYKEKPFCYLNVNLKKHYVDVGFWKGKAIQTHKSHHTIENRKQIISLRYTNLESINATILIDILNAAVALY